MYMGVCVFELGYNIKKWTEISVSLQTGFVTTKEYNAVVNSGELITFISRLNALRS